MDGSYKAYTDENLLDLMREQDDTCAFDEIYQRYVHQLLYTAARKTGDNALAEDLVQELFVKFWLNRKSCTIEKSLVAYLHGMLRHHVISHYHKVQSKSPAPLDYAVALADEKTTEQIQYNVLNDLYEQSLRKLPEKCRQVFVLSRRGYSQKEIALAQNISEKTVEAHISKALRILRVEMKDYIVFALIINSLSFLF